MSTGITATQSLGSIGSVMIERNKQMAQTFGIKNFDHKSFLFMSGYDADKMLQTYENEIEGNSGNGDGVDGNLLSWDNYYYDENDSAHPNNFIFQGAGKTHSATYTEIDFNNGQVRQMDSTGLFEQFFDVAPNSTEAPYDYVEFGQGDINFMEFDFTNSTSEKDLTPITFNSSSVQGKRTNGTFTLQNINPNTKQNSGLMQRLLQNASGWLSATEADKLVNYYESGNESKFLSYYKTCLTKHFQ